MSRFSVVHLEAIKSLMDVNLTSRYISICCGYIPNLYKQVVRGYVLSLYGLFPQSLFGVILFHGFYMKLFSNIINHIKAPFISSTARAKLLRDAMFILSRHPQWNSAIVAILGTFFVIFDCPFFPNGSPFFLK